MHSSSAFSGCILANLRWHARIIFHKRATGTLRSLGFLLSVAGQEQCISSKGGSSDGRGGTFLAHRVSACFLLQLVHFLDLSLLISLKIGTERFSLVPSMRPGRGNCNIGFDK